MKKLTKFYVLPILLITILGLTQCKPQKHMVQKKLPFSITEKTYQYWTGGKEGSANGTNLMLKGTVITDNFHVESIFFHNREEKVVANYQSDFFTVNAHMVDPVKKDINMSSSSVDEYGNSAPVETKNIPFTLNDDEAILYYTANGKGYYHKITGIKQLETINRP